MKRFIGIITAIILSLLYTVSASAQTNREYSDSVELLKGLGIFSGDFNKTEDNEVTRADFIKYVLNFRGIDSEQHTRNVGFYDVDELSSYSAAVNAGVSLGLVSGYDDGSFKPEESIMCEHAERVMVLALGGDKLLRTGQATEHELASKLGISLNENGQTKMTYNLLTRFLIKALSAKPLLIEIGEHKTMEYSKNDALWVYHKTKKVSGVVDANHLTGLKSVNDAAKQKGYIKLYGTQMQYDAESYSDILGKHVEAYVCMEDEEEPVIKYITETKRNKIIDLQSDMIYGSDVKFSAYNFVYENENGKETEKKLDGNTAVIYNGIAKPDYSKENISPEIGWVKLIDNNSDGKTDVLNVFNADLTLVSGKVSANADLYVITDKFNNSKYVKLNSDQLDDTEIFVNGEPGNIGNIKEDMLVIRGINGEHTVIYAYDNSITGKVESITDDELRVDGKIYKVSKSCDISAAKLNYEYRFYMDDRNFVFAFDKIGTDNELHYGYLLDYKADTESDTLNAVVLKILTDENILERFVIRDKIKVNDKNLKLEKLDELLNPNKVFSRQPIRYKLDENNNITVLHTVTKDGMLKYEGEFTGAAEYAFYADTWSQKFYQDSDTLVFYIFDDMDNCYVGGAFKNVVLNPRPYTHYFYNVDQKLNTVDMVVWKRSDTASQNAEAILPETKPIVVTQVCQMLDSDDEARNCLIGIRGSDELKVFYNDKMIQVYKDRFNEIKAGDIIYCEFDGRGNLNKIFRGFDSSRMEEYGVSNSSNTVNGIHQVVAHARKKLAYINVTEKLNNRFVKYDDGSGELDNIQKIHTSAKIYKVIKSSRGVSVSLSSYDEIMPGDKIFFDADTNTVWNLYILEYK